MFEICYFRSVLTNSPKIVSLNFAVSPSDQSPRCPHEETFGPYLPIAKFRGVSPRNLANFGGENLRRNNDFYFSPRKNKFRARGVPRRNAKKELFSWPDL